LSRGGACRHHGALEERDCLTSYAQPKACQRLTLELRLVHVVTVSLQLVLEIIWPKRPLADAASVVTLIAATVLHRGGRVAVSVAT